MRRCCELNAAAMQTGIGLMYFMKKISSEENEMGSTLNSFRNKFEEFKTLPAGQSFTIKVTDQEATAAACEYLAENKASVGQKIKKRTGLSLDIDNPTVTFRNDEIGVSASGGKGFLKAKATLDADVQWNGQPTVVVRSVKVPVVSVTPEKLNSVVEKPLKQLMEKVEEYAEIHNFKLQDGFAVLEAIRK